MNAVLATARPLPTALRQDSTQAVPSLQRRRRSHVGGFRLAPMEVDRFNAFLISLGRTQAPYDRDQLATASRELCDCSTGIAPMIGLQMRRAAAAALMVSDLAWDADNDARVVASRVVGYVRAGSVEQYELALAAAIGHQGVDVIELPTNRDENLAAHNRVWSAVAEALRP